MSESDKAYVSRDRLAALADGEELPPQATGSVLFADISGFTPLTEAYEAALGARRGGEELTRLMNEVYAVLIGEVERQRGSVIGFAGDAVTCWFDGDDGLRAVSCALAMQAGMAAFGAVPSPAGGTAALGLKAAVTCGTVRRFAVGDPALQRADVLAGDPVYRVAELEQLAQRGEVVMDGAALAAVGRRARVLGERRNEAGEPVAWVVAAVRAASDVAPWPDIDGLEVPRELVDPWLIAVIRERLRAGLGEFLTELRPATAVFIKFEGIDFEDDPEADHKLDQFFSRVQHIVAEVEGVVHQLTVGDKGSFLYAAFGAPVSHEDDTVRALATALRVRALATEFDFIEAIRIGISRGTTRTGAYGGPTRRAYGVLGDQVNLAARLMGKAAPGQILVAAVAAREGERIYRFQELEPVRVKGKSEPVSIHALEGLREDRAQATAGYGLPMVGRSVERARLQDWVAQAAGGRGQVVSIVGEAGMGKSRLAAEGMAVARSGGFRLLFGECQSFGTNTPYTPWWPVWCELFGLRGDEKVGQAASLLGERLAALDERFRDRLPLLGPVLNIQLPDNDLTRTFDAKLQRASLDSLLVEWLRAAAARQPLLIVIDDAHAIDAASRDLLRTLVQALARMPVLLLVVGRLPAAAGVLSPDQERLDYVHRLELGEFSPAESAELIRAKFAQLRATGEPVPPAAVAHITARTGGNPFFIEEVMNWIHYRRIDITSARSLERAELPVSLHALVLSRMDQLDESARVTLKVASVIGRLFRAALLWGVYPELGGEQPVSEALDLLSRRDFTLREEGDVELAYLFKHVVIHEVAYESLTHQLRARLHESIGHFIEAHLPADSPKVLDLLAFHFGRSNNTGKQREYFRRAGDAARVAYASAAAAAHYEALLPLLGEAEQIEVLQHLGQVHETAGDWERSRECHHQALRLALAHARAREAAQCRLCIGDLLRKGGALEEAGQWLTEAREACIELGDEAGIAQACHSAGTLAAQTGKYDEARELYARSMEIRRRLGDEAKVASLLSNSGIIARFQGDLPQALALQEQSLAIRRRLNDPWAIGNSLNNLGMAKRYTGDFDGARSDLEEALRVLQQVGDRAEIANTLNSLAEVALDQQDAAGCEAFLQQSLNLTRELGNLRGLAFLLEAFASNAFFQQRPVRCLRLIGAARALRQSIGAPLPDNDAARIDEVVDIAGQALRAADPGQHLAAGAALALSAALDEAALADGVSACN